MKRRLASVCLATAATALFCGADWLQFRGNQADGVAADDAAPVSWSDAAWKAALPGRGLSGPIVIGDRVVVTSSSGYRQDRLHVLCFDARTGKEEWHRQFWATGRTMCHQKMSVATPTPASDGKRIFAFYSSNDLACLDLEGNLLWYRGLTHDFPNASNSLGMASSPLVAGETLIVQVESDAESFATGLDVETGLPRWKLDRPRRANWTSPALLKDNDGKPGLVLLQSSEGLAGVEPATGNVVWSYKNGAATIPSSVVAAGTIYVPSNGLTALRPIEGSEAPELVWQVGRLAPSTASPLVYAGRVYVVNRAGVVVSADPQNGDVRWQLRLKGPFSGTPVAAGGHLYFINEEGLAQVVQPGETEGEVVSEFSFGETILCTPAIADGALYVRSDAHLWKVAK